MYRQEGDIFYYLTFALSNGAFINGALFNGALIKVNCRKRFLAFGNRSFPHSALAISPTWTFW